MTQLSRPTPRYGHQPQKEKVVTSITLKLGHQHYEARTFDGGETSIISVEEIIGNADQRVDPVWQSDWTEVSPGIRTKLDAIEIQRSACPVRISFKQERHGRVYKDKTYTEERYSNTDRYQIQYEQG